MIFDINKIYVEYEFLDSFIVQDYFTGVISSIWGDSISKSNNLRFEQKYKDGEKHGSCREWYKNGQLKKEEQYKCFKTVSDEIDKETDLPIIVYFDKNDYNVDEEEIDYSTFDEFFYEPYKYNNYRPWWSAYRLEP